MFKTTLATLGFAAIVAATPAFADPAPRAVKTECEKGQVAKIPGKGADGKPITFCVRDADVGAFEKWVARCKQQSDVRIEKGAGKDDVSVVYSKDGGRPHCHIDAAHVAESGAIDD